MDKKLQELLFASFADADIEWRLQWNDEAKGNGLAVPYVNNRAIQNRLDKAVGVDKWKNEYIPWHHDGKKASQICGISIYFEERGEWVTKYDGAENSDIEPVKGGLSDSMKRAAVEWGIGRYLYGMDAIFVATEKKGRSVVIKEAERSKLDQAHQKYVARFFKNAPTAEPAPKPAAAPAKQQTPAATPAAVAPRQEAQPPTAPNTDGKPMKQGEYEVVRFVLQPSAKGGNNTHIQLKGHDGSTIEAYLQGENPSIAPGVRITDAKITAKIKQGVRFLILNEFRLAEQAAA